MSCDRYLVECGLARARGVVTTLAPAFDRARLCRGTLDLLGLHAVPVGVGTDGGDVAGVHTAASFTPSAATYMPFAHSESTARLEVMIEE